MQPLFRDSAELNRPLIPFAAVSGLRQLSATPVSRRVPTTVFSIK